MRNPAFATGHIYHVYNRGVEKRKVFLNERDYLRFVAGLYIFNDTTPALNAGRSLIESSIEVRLQSEKKKRLVEIIAFCLMPNHYHLLLRQRVDGGITEFMRKLGTGYTNYFNLKNDRVGPLFQGKFKAVLLEDDAHFAHLPHYIHCNPIEILMPMLDAQHREVSVAAILREVGNYRWSSLRDYIGIENFPTVTDRRFLQECIGSPQEFRRGTRDWIASWRTGKGRRRAASPLLYIEEKILETPSIEVRLR